MEKDRINTLPYTALTAGEIPDVPVESHTMRRKDREIADIDGKLKIIDGNRVCRLALSDDGQPYIVPLNYGYSFDDGALTLYFHSACEGRKLEIIKRNNRACFEIDGGGILVEGERPCSYGCVFESIVGTGRIVLLSTAAEKEDGLNSLMRHQTGKDELYHFDEKMMERVVVYKMVVEEFAGKGRFPDSVRGVSSPL
jgi:nitroimidazol reductase NimA-like FMN-containing flavoprotein (pyridoxamine 5'-phosphate oxidase superfamily)